MTRFISTSFSLPIEDTPTDTEPPCGAISKLVTNDKRVVPVDLALRCLRSVPLDKEGNLLQLAGLKSMVEFQSDLSYLKDPPPGYLYPGVDILGELDAIGERLKSDKYTSEYEYQLELHNIIAAAHDGHLAYLPDILSVFQYARLVSENARSDGSPDYFLLFSVSDDGVQLPSIYDSSDCFALVNPTTYNYKPSPIIKINGANVEDRLNAEAAMEGRFQDPDANYNFLFRSLPHNSTEVLGHSNLIDNVFALGLTDDGSTTEIAFANGTTRRLTTSAIILDTDVLRRFQNVSDGETFFEAFCRHDSQPETLPSVDDSPSGPITQVPYKPIRPTGAQGIGAAYPSPYVIAGDGSVAGYFPETQPDLAVLAIPSYEPGNQVEFENVIRELLATAKFKNKTKLIIDLRGNTGGTTLLAADTFRQLFPSMSPYGAGNYRASDLFNLMGQMMWTSYTNETDISAILTHLAATLLFDFHRKLDRHNGDFDSWKDFFGPLNIHGGEYTSLDRVNLSDLIQRGGVDVFGYGSDTAPQPQTFEADNIILLQDGICASTCTIFTEYMKTQAHVRQIVVGGRKQQGPMQGVGGVKGSSVQKLSTLLQAVVQAVSYSTPSQKQYFNDNYGPEWIKSAVQVNNRAPHASVNFRNNIRQGDNTMTPLQFVYEAADCRFFYTAPMYADQELVWDMTYKLAWENGTCVEGSTGHVSAAPWRIGEV